MKWTDDNFNEELVICGKGKGDRNGNRNKNYRSSSAWSETNHIITAAKFLGLSKNPKILDIGSGVGKFAIIAGETRKRMKITGVELQNEYYNVANEILSRHPNKNVNFINADFLSLDVSSYTGFYFFNPFVMGESDPNYKSWAEYQLGLASRLCSMPIGTRLVVNCKYNNNIPDCYVEQGSHERLFLMIKEN